MTRLILIRHAPTPWNRAKKLQGRTDVPLDAAAEAWVRAWRLPPEARGLAAIASPLARAFRTAEILLGAAPAPEPRLVEMAYGAWEGETIADLAARLGPALAENEARGWDFQPPGGESPRMVRARVAPLLAEIAAEAQTGEAQTGEAQTGEAQTGGNQSGGTQSGGPPGRIAVCHTGVIRTILGWASGWDHRHPPPAVLTDGTAHLFTLAADGTPTVERLNLPLTDAPPPAAGSAAREPADG
ncbi:MAG: histidine phosphatase family protein [Alphaproteobacteria bacterium]|nr:histidine phosphatase family protein [Alphaproteobacteria bacterium]